jgi:hypothetical protein
MIVTNTSLTGSWTISAGGIVNNPYVLPPINTSIPVTRATTINGFSGNITSTLPQSLNCGYQTLSLTAGSGTWFLNATIVPINDNIGAGTNTLTSALPFSLNSYT